MGLLTRDSILAAEDLRTERVAVPEWGGAVCIRTLTGLERDAFEATWYEGRGTSRRENFANLRARLVVLTAVDESGARLFNEDDTKALGAKNAAALDRCFAVAQRLSGLSAKDVEDLAGNSESGLSGGSTSASRKSSA